MGRVGCGGAINENWLAACRIQDQLQPKSPPRKIYNPLSCGLGSFEFNSNLVFIMRTYSNLMVRLPCLENSYTVRVARQTMVHPPVHVGCVKAIMALVLEQIVRTFILQSDRIRRSKMALFG